MHGTYVPTIEHYDIPATRITADQKKTPSKTREMQTGSVQRDKQAVVTLRRIYYFAQRSSVDGATLRHTWRQLRRIATR